MVVALTKQKRKVSRVSLKKKMAACAGADQQGHISASTFTSYEVVVGLAPICKQSGRRNWFPSGKVRKTLSGALGENP